MAAPETPSPGAARFPPLPLEAWESTKNTLHLYLQIVGKIRLALAPKLNHWWHVTYHSTASGLTTRPMPYGDMMLDMRFDFVGHGLDIATSRGDLVRIPLHDGLSVSRFYRHVFDALRALGIDIVIDARPYDTFSTIPFEQDDVHARYDRDAIAAFWRVMQGAWPIFETFAGRFIGKSTPVHLFWHSFDLALTRFSGRAAPLQRGTAVAKEAYSHEVISFGFWAGDAKVREAAFYSYAYPEPSEMTNHRLAPEQAYWAPSGSSHLALLPYESFRASASPRETLLTFFQSAYDIAAKEAAWPLSELSAPG